MQYTFDKLAAWDGSPEEGLTRQVELLQTFAGGPHGYRLRRIMLTNFWLYGQQEFEIPHGRLFLAGENASGKSTVLTAALPLALDGDLRPNRLDTFGGRERHIEYYVLGSDKSATPFNYERRTAYVALEFEWCDPDRPPLTAELRQLWERGEREKARFLTIGISLAGNINASSHIKALRFLVTDGSRFGYELQTVAASGPNYNRERRAHDHTKFRQMLEGHGIICETQDDYERQVARCLFGFTEIKDFTKLIDLLLILRRPNLSSELSFSRVHEHLKQSLRKISSETTTRVTGTIERIDAIQNEIDHLQEAYDATKRLHLAQQDLALAEAKQAACDYIGDHLAENNLQAQTNRLRKDLFAADNERNRAETEHQGLTSENQQVSGQIKALEGSEGLQIAERLTSMQKRTEEMAAQARGQEQSLATARQAIRANDARILQQQGTFEKSRKAGQDQLRTLTRTASEEALWETADVPLQEASGWLNSLTLTEQTAPEAPRGILALTGAQAQERLTWLKHLEELHGRKEALETEVQHLRASENTRFAELDEARSRLQTARDDAYDAWHGLLLTLEELIAESKFLDDRGPAIDIPEIFVQGSSAVSEETHAEALREQLEAIIVEYRQALEGLERELRRAEERLQSDLEQWQQSKGSKARDLQELETQYQQKLAEPEIAPGRHERRNHARAVLAERGITAFPLYALIDFTPEVDDARAGRIERMLEDAGLLDALVVAPAQLAAADALLAKEGLSDCRLNVGTAATRGNGDDMTRWLSFDRAISDNVHAGRANWEAITTEIVSAIGYRAASDGQDAEQCVLREDGVWRHGLLAGQAGTGEASGLIGKANRLRTRQRELDALNEQRTRLAEELKQLEEQIASAVQRRTNAQEERARLGKVLGASGVEQRFHEILGAQKALGVARDKYEQAHQRTQEVRQKQYAAIARLEREGRGFDAFVGSKERVKEAAFAMVKLDNQVRPLQQQFESLVDIWREHLQTLQTLEGAKREETRVAALYTQVQSQLAQAQAELGELQRVAASQNVAELGVRLHDLRDRSEALVKELNEAVERKTRAAVQVQNLQERLESVEEELQRASERRAEKQARFVELLGAYAALQLAAALQLVKSGNAAAAAQKLLGETVHTSEVAARKDALANEYRAAYNNLLIAFNQESHFVHEYGPDLDAQGRILFLKENRSSPFVLLELLSEKIEMQRDLLGREERELFENFLLQEIAEAIRTHILESEEWVQQINKVLSGLPMIGEHYTLEWKPSADYDQTKLGSKLAIHYKLLRKPAQTLTPQETETLMDAFRQEITEVRLRQKEDPTLNFMEVLELIFDYREWFHFDVFVTPTGGQRQRLTDRVAGTRSGAEQLFALYVPLFAALAALYKTAAPGAPRLLALDEAFDKASLANTQSIMEFLASQEFQWIMTGPRIEGTGSKVPVSARYLMLHEKGSPVAAASASFWCGTPPDSKN